MLGYVAAWPNRVWAIEGWRASVGMSHNGS